MKSEKHCQTCKGKTNLVKDKRYKNTLYYKCKSCLNLARKKYYNTPRGKERILIATMKNYAKRFGYKLTKETLNYNINK